MRLAGKAVTSKDKCYRIHRDQKFSLKLFSLASMLMVIISGEKNLLHQSEKFLEDGLREKEKKQRNFSSLLIPKNIQSNDYLLGKWGKQESAE